VAAKGYLHSWWCGDSGSSGFCLRDRYEADHWNMEERIRMMAVGCPIATVVGGGIGVLIVFRAERLEAK